MCNNSQAECLVTQNKKVTYPVWICIGIPRCVATSRARMKMKSTRAFCDTRTGLPKPITQYPKSEDDFKYSERYWFSRMNCSSINCDPCLGNNIARQIRRLGMHSITRKCKRDYMWKALTQVFMQCILWFLSWDQWVDAQSTAVRCNALECHYLLRECDNISFRLKNLV